MAAALIMPKTEARTKRMVEGYIVRWVKKVWVKMRVGKMEMKMKMKMMERKALDGAGGGVFVPLYLSTSLCTFLLPTRPSSIPTVLSD